ncbi:MAG: DPP IV N-terminal domain-containing protein, partial [Acidobacteriota bacterium]
LTTNGRISHAAISPDGKYIVYSQQENDKSSLSVRQTNSTSGLNILTTQTGKFNGLSFSPDSTRILYIIFNEQTGISTLYQIPVLGGTPNKLLDDVDSPVTFSPDGRQFAFVRGYREKQQRALIICNWDGTVEHELARSISPDLFSFAGPAWSPDGKVIATTVGTIDLGNPNMRVITVDVKDGQTDRVGSESWSWAGQVAWLSDGNGLVLPAWHQQSPHFTDQLWYLTYPEGRVERVTNDLDKYSSISTSQNGLILTIQTSRHSKLSITPNSTNNREVEINTGFGDNYSEMFGISWLPNGNIVYGGNASGNVDLWVINRESKEQRQLTTDPSADLSPATSPDGSYIVFYSFKAKIPHIWRMDTDGNNLRQLTNGSGETLPNLSPDGKWVVYTALNQGRSSIWKISIEGGEPVQLTDYDSFHPVISPDGNRIAFYMFDRATRQRKIAIMAFQGNEPQTIINEPITAGYGFSWSADNSSLIYTVNQNGTTNLWSQPISGGPPQQLSHYPTDQIFRFARSYDGQLWACERGVTVSDLVLIR